MTLPPAVMKPSTVVCCMTGDRRDPAWPTHRPARCAADWHGRRNYADSPPAIFSPASGTRSRTCRASSSLGREALAHRLPPRLAIAPHLLLIHGDANAPGPKLGRIAEQLVHHRPQALFLLEQRTDRDACIRRRCAPTPPSRRYPCRSPGRRCPREPATTRPKGRWRRRRR